MFSVLWDSTNSSSSPSLVSSRSGPNFPRLVFPLNEAVRSECHVLPGLLGTWRVCSFALSGTSAALCRGRSGAARRPPEETQRHRAGQEKGCGFIMMVVGSQIALFRPGCWVKLHVLGFNCVDELPCKKRSERTTLIKRSSKTVQSDLWDGMNTLNQIQFQFECRSEIRYIDNVSPQCVQSDLLLVQYNFSPHIGNFLQQQTAWQHIFHLLTLALASVASGTFANF